ncbi:uncharacterized protein TNCV_3146421 [Trichonephila clavipes]|nr:uncharacterized protein TNCV_3146421 [Trichonephila clavipes]
MLQNRIIPSLADKHLLERTIFMQDGAPPHIARRVKDLLRRSFGDDRMLSHHFHHAWPPRSPDLSPDAERQHPTPMPHHNSGHALQCCSQHYSRLQLLLRNDGEHIEHFL